MDEWSVGERIASHRRRRGLTQDELAGLVGLSLSMMKKIESGDRPVTRFSQLVLFAQALQIKDLRDLTGVPLPLMPDGHRGHPAARAVLAAMVDRRAAGEPARANDEETYRDAAARLDRTWQTWQELVSTLAVLGGLNLMGATLAARDERVSDTRRLLDIADDLARRTGETNHHRMVFGPTNVAIHRVSTATELGRTAEALALSERVTVHEAPSVERRLTFHLDTARCYSRQRNDVGAVHMLERMHRESPEELRYNVLARQTLRELARRVSSSLASDLAPLLRAAALPS